MIPPGTGSTLEQTLQRYCMQAGASLQTICLHVLAGGRRTRANLLLRAAARQDTAALQAACAVEMMHAATLLQDDIFDRSTQRRGRTAAHVQFGSAQTVLASDWLLLRALELAADVDAAFFRQLACAARTMAATVSRELKPPALSGFAAARRYIADICEGKTACLFAVSLQAAALLQAEPGVPRLDQWAAIGTRIGCTYQLLDDCLDVYAPAGAVDKSTRTDLLQGRLTLPLLTAVQSLGERVTMDSFLNATLSTAQQQVVLYAAASNATRQLLHEQVRNEMRLIDDAARQACVPREAIAPVLTEMAAKATLCFGREHDGEASVSVQSLHVHAA